MIFYRVFGNIDIEVEMGTAVQIESCISRPLERNWQWKASGLRLQVDELIYPSFNMSQVISMNTETF